MLHPSRDWLQPHNIHKGEWEGQRTGGGVLVATSFVYHVRSESTNQRTTESLGNNCNLQVTQTKEPIRAEEPQKARLLHYD